MESLALGLIAALAWGVHDLCVRYVSQKTGIFASLVTVLFFGCLLTIPVSLYSFENTIGPNAYGLSVLSGALFGVAGIALYKAFAIGPVRLVAPIIGAYPVFSILWASLAGQPISIEQIGSIALIIMGVGYVSAAADQSAKNNDRKAAIAWSVFAGLGFASCFAIGQMASAHGGEWQLLAPTRIAALLTVLLIALWGRHVIWPGRGQIWILLAMGCLDALALSAVISSGRLPNPEYASVAASTFGLITVILVALFLREKITLKQALAVALVFCSIVYLGL